MIAPPTKTLIKKIASRTVQIFPMLLAISDNAAQNFAALPDLRDLNHGHNPYVSEHKYWTTRSTSEVIDMADRAYKEEQYLDVYELLNRFKHSDNIEVQWRIARSLYKLSQEEHTYPTHIRKEMITEAYDLLFTANDFEPNPNIYKWMAIVLDTKSGFDGLDKRVLAYPQVKILLKKAIKMNPDDSTCYYILGKWCFDMSHMNWVQRMFTKVMFGPVPDTSLQEAYDYLLRSYQIKQDNYYIPIMYMLGEICYRLKQYFRAEFYLKSATVLPPRTKFEYECMYKSKRLLDKLELYNLAKEAVLFEYPFNITPNTPND